MANVAKTLKDGEAATGRVRLEKYNPGWPAMYREEAMTIQGTLGHEAKGLEHFGSTSIPGLSSKPIIDIVLGLDVLPTPARVSGLLEGIGYSCIPEVGARFPGMEYFHKGAVEWRAYHLHVVEHGGPTWVRYLAFRDYLGRNPKTTAEYEKLKWDLASRFEHDRTRYTEAKRSFVDKIVRTALREGIRGGR